MGVLAAVKQAVSMLCAAVLSQLAYAESSDVSRQLPREVLGAFAKAGLPSDQFSISIRPHPAGRGVSGNASGFGHRSSALLNPASVTKVFTTGYALEVFQSTHQFRTGFQVQNLPVDGVLNGSLYIKGSGDPGLSTRDLWSALRALRQKGLQHIKGNVVLDTSIFANHGLMPSEPFDEAPHRAYHAQPHGLLLNHGALSVQFEPIGGQMRITAEEAPASWAFVSEVQAAGGDCNAWKNDITVDEVKKGTGVTVTFKGRYPVRCGASVWPIRITQPDWLFESWFKEMWSQLGGVHSGAFVQGKTPENTTVLHAWLGPTLAEHIREVNKWSNNVMARHLELLASPAPVGQTQGNLAQAANVQAFNASLLKWLNALGVPTPQWFIENGSGLSRQTRVDASGLTLFLNKMAERSDFPDYLASFPRAGVDGTLRRRFAAVEGHAYLKSGSLNDVRTIAGYVRDVRGQWWSVALLVNGPKAELAWPAFEQTIQWVYQGV